MNMTTYRIVRFYSDDRPLRVLATGMTEEEAKAHCSPAWSTGDGWFDGYQREAE
jgi:hypothetical protein